MNQHIQKYISFVVIVLVIILGAFLLWRGEKANAPADTADTTEVPDKSITVTPDTKIDTQVPSSLTKEQGELLIKLRKSVTDRNFETFASLLQEVYKNQWMNVKELIKEESNMYVYTTDNYFAKGDLANSLRVSTIVYDKVSEAWRFRYLRILTLEKYGRNALNAGDLKTAEDYASRILHMMYRIEGANLLADIYISKIKDNIKDMKIDLAKQNLTFIWDYEVSQDRRDTLTNFKTQLGM